ncbi:hypothetical protein DM52_4760 [Burkholderia mallei]|nr:hypothetical protein DM52_4760 [Burkholderia mallei]
MLSISASAQASAARPAPSCIIRAPPCMPCSTESSVNEIAAPATKHSIPRCPTATTGRAARASRAIQPYRTSSAISHANAAKFITRGHARWRLNSPSGSGNPEPSL